MVRADEIYRAHVAQINRVLATYISIEAWMRGIDCALITRDDFLAYQGLKKISNERREWFQSDAKKYFTYSKHCNFIKSSKMGVLILSRKELVNFSPENRSITQFAAIWTEKGLSTQIVRIPEYKIVLNRISSLAHGLEVEFTTCQDDDE